MGSTFGFSPYWALPLPPRLESWALPAHSGSLFPSGLPFSSLPLSFPKRHMRCPYPEPLALLCSKGLFPEDPRPDLWRMCMLDTPHLGSDEVTLEMFESVLFQNTCSLNPETSF